MNNTVNATKRIDEIDILKGIGIVFMVSGHSGTPFRSFIYLFHMAIFFMASGYFFKEKHSYHVKTTLSTIMGKFRRLWVPFFLWNGIYVLFHNFFLSINIYTDNNDILNYIPENFVRISSYYSVREMLMRIAKGVMFSTNESILAPCWFLKTLFLISVLYASINYICVRVFSKYTLVIQAVVSILLLVIGYYCSIRSLSYKGIELVASYYCLYYLGYLFGYYKELYTKWSWKYQLILFFASLFMLLLFKRNGSVELVMNQYINPFHLLGTSFFGWVFVYSVSYFIKYIPIMKMIMIILGKHTLSVVLHHVLCLKIVAILVKIYYDVPDYCIAAFPNLYGDRGLWWLLYTVVGTAIPIVLDCIYGYFTDYRKKAKKMEQIHD